MEAHYWRMLSDSEERAYQALLMQECDPDSPHYGAFYDRDYLVQAKFSIYRVTGLITVYCNPDSEYYHDAMVYDRILAGLGYVHSVQHENGLFDYITCNFLSAPDTAFCLWMLFPIVDFLRGKEKRTAEEELILEQTEQIVKKGVYGLTEGGFHTPNHRWAIASSLTKGAVLFQDDRLREEAFTYLREGIDCNEDGEYSEKSAGNYNSVNNSAMMLLTESLGDDSYAQCAVRNLWMMFAYWEPDDSIFTANSTRYDKDRLVYPTDYYLQYLKLGIRYEIPEFLQMSRRIFEIAEEKHLPSPDGLLAYMMDPTLRLTEVQAAESESEYRHFFEKSGIYRERKGCFTCTVMKDKSEFLHFHNGSISLKVKLAGSFCEHRAFRAETMEQLPDGTIHLHQTMRGWYYLPFEEPPQTSDWWEMDASARKKRIGPDMSIDVWVTPADTGVNVRLVTAGTDGAPWRVELAFSGIDHIANEHFAMPVSGEERLILCDGRAEAYNRADSILVGPCFGNHRFIDGKEDSEGKTPGAATIYLTDYTGFDHVLQIRNRRDEAARQYGRDGKKHGNGCFDESSFT